jgi:putative membrane-bound dehydrogenase-like protein
MRTGTFEMPLRHACIVVSLATIAGLFVDVPAFGDKNVRVPAGFAVRLYADDELAHNIFSMTLDAKGRVVVSGPGYVRILLDTDDDGKADAFKQFADGPKAGAQGMYFLGRNLLCTGDQGIVRYRDGDADDRADGPPDLLVKIKTGGEHHAHSIQSGPDGWWYLIAGNQSEITADYASLPTSPIRKPKAGTLLRLNPSFSRGEIFADGFRNAYDFAFNRQGDLFTFDSDGERDVSLPWYQPIRVFHVLPGSSAGWMDQSWKRANYFLDMPPVVASFGRGSPSGVVCYRHRQFPRKYDNALFVLDWTFGRVFALPLERDAEKWAAKPIEFMTAAGQHGFAPTDVAVGPDGSLFVSVGGRGTRGGVYRVTYQDAAPAQTDAPPENGDTAHEDLTACLEAPQPLSSWSRAAWIPIAKRLGRERFLEAVLDENMPVQSRVRAIEIITEHFGGLNAESAAQLANAKSAVVRARVAWSLGRADSAVLNAGTRLPFLTDHDPMVLRFALESLIGAGPGADFSSIVSAIARALGNNERFVRQTASRLVAKLDQPTLDRLARFANEIGPQAVLTMAYGLVDRDPVLNHNALDFGMGLLEENHPAALDLEAARLMQLALGDLGVSQELPPVFSSYSSQLDLSRHERSLDSIRIRLAELYPTGDRVVDLELSRLLGMLGSYNASLLDQILSQITADSSPMDDIHHLLVAARIPVQRDLLQRRTIARALVELDPKIARRRLRQDSHWVDRVGEMYGELVKHDPGLPEEVVNQEEFGRPGHVLFLSQLHPDLLDIAVSRFVKVIEDDDDYDFNSDIVFVLGESKDPKHREMLREQFDSFAVRAAVLLVLSENPAETDRDKFVTGLESSQLEVSTACLEALGELPAKAGVREQLALVKLLRTLGSDEHRSRLARPVVKLLRRNTGKDFGFDLEASEKNPQLSVVEKWTAWVTEQYPDESASAFGTDGINLDELNQVMAEVNWERGDSDRGRKLFQKRSCAQCHGGRRALGPDLAGVAQRFSRADLFTAIAAPNRDVSSQYRTSLIVTTKGVVHTGLVVYESADGLMLRSASNQTFRIEADEIESRNQLGVSLMPNGLLKGLKPDELADLFAYMTSLGRNDLAGLPATD